MVRSLPVIAGLAVAFGAVGVTSASAVTTEPVWPAASEFTMPPSGASTAAGDQDAYLSSVTCASPGTCVAVGGYEDTNGNNDFQVMATTETSGVWGQASELTLPAGASTAAGDQSAYLASVACTSPGNCVAVGQYRDNNEGDDYQAMVATETSGVWGQASELTLPSGANTVAEEQYAILDSVTCTSPGDCVAVGGYNDSSNDGQAMVAIEMSGVWGQASELTLPSGANMAAKGDQEAFLNSVTCTSPGECVTVGSYDDANGIRQAMVAAETSGVWGQASEFTMLPSDASTAPGDQSAALASVTCTSPGNCVAGGDYVDTNGRDDHQAMVTTETSGVWGQASELTLPSGANTAASDQNVALASVTCTSPGNCVAGGSYEDTKGSNDYQAMVAVETSGVWGQASELTLPSGANTTAGDQSAFFGSVTCTGPGSCVGVGSYEDSSSNEQAMVLTSIPSLAVSTASLPAVVGGSAYSAQLSATGGVGSYTWSLSSGSLPAGLSLNASTGVISGTPTASGRSSFTVAVSDPGPLLSRRAPRSRSSSTRRDPERLASARSRSRAPSSPLRWLAPVSRSRSARAHLRSPRSSTFSAASSRR